MGASEQKPPFRSVDLAPVTLLGAIRAGWTWRNIVTCFVRREHLRCRGCTPRCGRCAWCYRPLPEEHLPTCGTTYGGECDR